MNLLKHFIYQFRVKQFERTVLEKLTLQEKKVFHFIMKGVTYKEIGKELHITISTASNHGSKILRKLGFSSRKDLEKKYKKRYKIFFDRDCI